MPLRQAPIRPVAGWRFRTSRPDSTLLNWLLDPGSLTARLVARAHGDFRVRVTRLAWARPALDESLALGLPAGEWALVREVELIGCGEAWVRARSVIPRQTLVGRNRRLRSLGNRPLGAFLFRDPTLQRLMVEIVSPVKSKGLPRASTHTDWGRRSTFRLRGHPLLVAEYFLPALLANPSDRPAGAGETGPVPDRPTA